MRREDRGSKRNNSEAAWLRAVVETAVDGVILIDAQGLIMKFNPACELLRRTMREDVEIVTDFDPERRAAFADPAQLDHLVEQAGAVDVLVNNAGFSWFGPTAELDVATFDRLFAANVRAAYFLVAALAPKMAARGSGSIISLGSMAGQIGLAGGAAYSATKATLAAMTRSWAAEFSPSGVRVNAIAAGPVLTNGAAPDRIAALGATTLLAGTQRMRRGTA